jgi:hypothetical protein
MRQKTLQSAEVFVPLCYRPGALAEVDFFAVVVDERGPQRHAWKFLMHLMDSGDDFVGLYDRCDQLAFLDAPVRALAYCGGVPPRMAYDNLTPAVRNIVGTERVLTERFAALATHYLFEACFARPGEGHDQGGVESWGQAIRVQPLTPIPAGETLQAIAAATLSEVEQASRTKVHATGQTVWAQFQEERPHCRALPVVAVAARRTESLLVNNRAMVQIERATYSVPSTWVGRTITAAIGVEDMCLGWQGETQVYAKQPRGAHATRTGTPCRHSPATPRRSVRGLQNSGRNSGSRTGPSGACSPRPMGSETRPGCWPNSSPRSWSMAKAASRRRWRL